jgi:hypothetical protein
MKRQDSSLVATSGKSLQAAERHLKFSSLILLSSTKENSHFFGYLRMSMVEWKVIATFH